MSEQRRRGPLGWIVRNPRRILFWFLLTLPLQYVASTGPVLWLLRKGVLPNGASSVVIFVYAPLQWLYDHIGFVKALFDWYLQLFPSPWVPEVSERRRSLSTWVTAGILTSVLYMPNLGPVIWFQNHRHFDAKFLKVLRCLYAPLEDVAGKSTEVRDGIDLYVDFRSEVLRCATKSNQRR